MTPEVFGGAPAPTKYAIFCDDVDDETVFPFSGNNGPDFNVLVGEMTRTDYEDGPIAVSAGAYVEPTWCPGDENECGGDHDNGRRCLEGWKSKINAKLILTIDDGEVVDVQVVEVEK